MSSTGRLAGHILDERAVSLSFALFRPIMLLEVGSLSA